MNVLMNKITSKEAPMDYRGSLMSMGGNLAYIKCKIGSVELQDIFDLHIKKKSILFCMLKICQKKHITSFID